VLELLGGGAVEAGKPFDGDLGLQEERVAQGWYGQMCRWSKHEQTD
jgi:hypothetical protein